MRSVRLAVFLAALAALALGAWWLWPGAGPGPGATRAAPAIQVVHVKLAPGASIASLDGSFEPLFDRDASAIALNRAEARARTGREAPDLAAWYRIDAGSARAAEALAARLRARADVVAAFVPPVPELAIVQSAGPPERSCPIQTPSYEPYQGYLSAAPAGINAPAAWVIAGGRGEGVGFADIEGAWNVAHEDIPGERITSIGGPMIRDRHWEAHGTAVVGVVASRDNGIGMVGIDPEVERIVVASIDRIGPAAAIDRAQAALEPGDVLLIELHGIGPRGRFVPMEFWDDVYDAIRLATDRGVIVVEAAGNGGENLDHRVYERKFDPSKRDSGAIMVGAGAPPRPGYTDRSRLWFSNYGKRVDVQGWGYRVATLDYGDLQDCNATDRKYTDEFSGTSSASPVVVGAVIALQGIHKARSRGAVLKPRAMRELLRATGTPQTDGPEGRASKQRIGPRPDLARAIEALPR